MHFDSESKTPDTELELIGVTRSFGGIRALDDVHVGFESHQVTCIIGPNGAGKTTLFNVVSGFLEADNGEVVYMGKSLGGLRPHVIARLGIGRLFQDPRIFDTMTLLENVAVASKQRFTESAAVAVLWPLFGRDAEIQNIRQAKSCLEFVGLEKMSEQWAGHVSYGQQKLVAIARLLNSNVNCFLFDEPTSGVHASMVAKLLDAVRRLAEAGKTVIVIEHNMNIVREIGDWVYLMDRGRIEAFGTPCEVLRDSALTRLFTTL